MEHVYVNCVLDAAILARHKRRAQQSFYHVIVLFIYQTGLPGTIGCSSDMLSLQSIDEQRFTLANHVKLIQTVM